MPKAFDDPFVQLSHFYIETPGIASTPPPASKSPPVWSATAALYATLQQSPTLSGMKSAAERERRRALAAATARQQAALGYTKEGLQQWAAAVTAAPHPPTPPARTNPPEVQPAGELRTQQGSSRALVAVETPGAVEAACSAAAPVSVPPQPQPSSMQQEVVAVQTSEQGSDDLTPSSSRQERKAALKNEMRKLLKGNTSTPEAMRGWDPEHSLSFGRPRSPPTFDSMEAMKRLIHQQQQQQREQYKEEVEDVGADYGRPMSPTFDPKEALRKLVQQQQSWMKKRTGSKEGTANIVGAPLGNKKKVYRDQNRKTDAVYHVLEELLRGKDGRTDGHVNILSSEERRLGRGGVGGAKKGTVEPRMGGFGHVSQRRPRAEEVLGLLVGRARGLVPKPSTQALARINHANGGTAKAGLQTEARDQALLVDRSRGYGPKQPSEKRLGRHPYVKGDVFEAGIQAVVDRQPESMLSNGRALRDDSGGDSRPRVVGSANDMAASRLEGGWLEREEEESDDERINRIAEIEKRLSGLLEQLERPPPSTEQQEARVAEETEPRIVFHPVAAAPPVVDVPAPLDVAPWLTMLNGLQSMEIQREEMRRKWFPHEVQPHATTDFNLLPHITPLSSPTTLQPDMPPSWSAIANTPVPSSHDLHTSYPMNAAMHNHPNSNHSSSNLRSGPNGRQNVQALQATSQGLRQGHDLHTSDQPASRQQSQSGILATSVQLPRASAVYDVPEPETLELSTGPQPQKSGGTAIDHPSHTPGSTANPSPSDRSGDPQGTSQAIPGNASISRQQSFQSTQGAPMKGTPEHAHSQSGQSSSSGHGGSSEPREGGAPSVSVAAVESYIQAHMQQYIARASLLSVPRQQTYQGQDEGGASAVGMGRGLVPAQRPEHWGGGTSLSSGPGHHPSQEQDSGHASAVGDGAGISTGLLQEQVEHWGGGGGADGSDASEGMLPSVVSLGNYTEKEGGSQSGRLAPLGDDGTGEGEEKLRRGFNHLGDEGEVEGGDEGAYVDYLDDDAGEADAALAQEPEADHEGRAGDAAPDASGLATGYDSGNEGSYGAEDWEEFEAAASNQGDSDATGYR